MNGKTLCVDSGFLEERRHQLFSVVHPKVTTLHQKFNPRPTKGRWLVTTHVLDSTLLHEDANECGLMHLGDCSFTLCAHYKSWGITYHVKVEGLGVIAPSAYL